MYNYISHVVSIIFRSKYHIYEKCDAPTKPFPVLFPEEGKVYDYQFVKENYGVWVPWETELKNVPAIPKDVQFNSIIIPTNDTVKYTYLMDLLVKHGKPCLFVGPTGTGKSVYVQVSSTIPCLILFCKTSVICLSKVDENFLSFPNIIF